MMIIGKIRKFINGYRDLDKVTLCYILFQAFFSLLLWIPIFFVFQLESGIDKEKIFFIQSVYYLVFCIFELPTGMLADKIGNKKAMILAAFILMVTNIVPVFFASYLGFMCHFILIAAARSLVSGSSSSYLFNYLKNENRSDEYKQIEGKARGLGLVIRVLIWPLAGPMMAFYKPLPYLITAINSFLAMLAAYKLKDDISFSESTIQTSNLAENKWNIRELISSITGSKVLMFFMFQGAGIFVLQRLCMIQLYQPLLKYQNFSLTSFGMMMSLATIFEALGAFKGHYLKKLFKDETTVFVMTAATAFCFLIMIIPIKWVTVIGFALFSLFAGIAFPVQKQLLNDNIKDSKYRASILSFESLGDRLLCSLASFLIGFAFKYDISVPNIFIIFFVLALLFLSSLVVLKKKALPSQMSDNVI